MSNNGEENLVVFGELRKYSCGRPWDLRTVFSQNIYVDPKSWNIVTNTKFEHDHWLVYIREHEYMQIILTNHSIDKSELHRLFLKPVQITDRSSSPVANRCLYCALEEMVPDLNLQEILDLEGNW